MDHYVIDYLFYTIHWDYENEHIKGFLGNIDIKQVIEDIQEREQ